MSCALKFAAPLGYAPLPEDFQAPPPTSATSAGECRRLRQHRTAGQRQRLRLVGSG